MKHTSSLAPSKLSALKMESVESTYSGEQQEVMASILTLPFPLYNSNLFPPTLSKVLVLIFR